MLIDKISYNLGAEMNQSAYSALVNGQTVCAGYARALGIRMFTTRHFAIVLALVMIPEEMQIAFMILRQAV